MLGKTLAQVAIEKHEGTEGINQTLCVYSGEYTARCPSGKYIVDQQGIDYNKYHQPVSDLRFQQYWEQANQHLGQNKTIGQYQVGQHDVLNLHVQIETELCWHQFLSEILFCPQSGTPLEQWTLRCCPNLTLSEEHPVFIGLYTKKKQILICGTGYGGEIKKSMFTIMNMILPQHNTLPMHCSAVLSPRKETSLLLGLSGTGKTTLSASNAFTLIGDDEHAWCPEGVFNLEHGCYAKTYHLSELDEPQIYHALHHPCIIENTVLSQGIPDFTNISITENIRAAYPLSNLNHHKGLAPHPKHIIFLCCDLYGVMPAVSLLNPQQAVNHFLTGYTAKVGSTEVNSDQLITPVSSPCFGHPFFPLPLETYASLFKQKILHYQPKIWLVNTGWHNGNYLSGKRFSIATTKQIIQTITCDKPDTKTIDHPYLDLQYVPQMNGHNLDFNQNWVQDKAFKKGCNTLENLFVSQQALTQD